MASGQQAPTIPGLTYVGFLGEGGFADVYLYQSSRPLREVAVKVLREKALSDALIKRFAEEADTMAALEHPYIVRVYRSGLTQDGRPYIEMAYYPELTLAQEVAKGPLPVPEVLRIGVQLASAVQAAHEVGLLHRDIKPANVLIDQYSDPALTDFGVASHLHQGDDADASLSVPWAPPEAMFATASLDVRSDVYSLAATLWHLLVGHAPFELPDGDNKANAMMVRVRDLPVPSTGRGDVPASLERLLKQAMSKEPRMRPASARDFAIALHVIEEELHLTPTPFKVARQSSRRPLQPIPRPAQDATRVRGPVVPALPAPPSALGAPPAMEDKTRLRAAPVVAPTPAVRHTGAGPQTEEEPDQASMEPTGSRRTWVIGAILVAVVIGCVLAWVFLAPTSTDPGPSNLPTPSVGDGDPVGMDTYPGRPRIAGEVVGDQIRFTWTYEYERDDDVYLVTIEPDTTTTHRLEDPTITLDYHGEPVCLNVRVARGNGGYAQPDATQGCAP